MQIMDKAIAISEIFGETGNVYLAGDTWSNDYPTTLDAYQPIAPDIISIQMMHLCQKWIT